MARIAGVGYLNARPLTAAIDIDRHTVTLAHPAEVARMLNERECDVALVPVAAVLGRSDLRIVPGVCIGSAGPVSSVVLAAETPPEQWTRVLLDGVSRTSVVLAELLLRHGPLRQRVRPDLEIVRVGPNTALSQARRSVAALAIGDAARELPGRFTVKVDLATEWREWTGLPFVFAVWAGRPELPHEVVTHLEAAGRKGIASVPTSYSGADLHYLTRDIRHTLDDAALTGLRRFAALAHQHGLVEDESFELYSPPRQIARPETGALLARALDGGALPPAELTLLLKHAPVAELCAAADLKRRELFPGDEARYRLAAVLPADAEPESLRPAVEAGATRIVLEGALTAERVEAVRSAFPGITLQGGTGAPGEDDPKALAAAGLTWALEESTGQLPSPAWLVWAERAAKAGLRLAATVAVGRGQSEEELVVQLLKLKDLPGLATVRVWAAEGIGSYGSVANTASDHLRVLALARLVLPGHVRLVASPATEGWGVAQCSLRSGCDDLGELVVTGDTERDAAAVAELEHQVREAALVPVREGARAKVALTA